MQACLSRRGRCRSAPKRSICALLIGRLTGQFHRHAEYGMLAVRVLMRCHASLLAVFAAVGGPAFRYSGFARCQDVQQQQQPRVS